VGDVATVVASAGDAVTPRLSPGSGCAANLTPLPEAERVGGTM